MEMVFVYCLVRVERLNTAEDKLSVQTRSLIEAVSGRPLTLKTRVLFKTIPCDNSCALSGVYTEVLKSP